MPLATNPRATPQSLWGRFVRWFFAHFFALLIAAISAAQWSVLWWIGGRPEVGAAIHLVAVASIYALNRVLIRRTRQHGLARHGIIRLPRLYYATAFTSLFCALFLLVNGVVWTTAKVFLGALAVEASGASAGLLPASPIDQMFRWFGNFGVAAIGLAFAYGYSIGQRRLAVRQLFLPLHGFGTALDGLRIAQISDIHIGPNLNARQLTRFVDKVNELRPDLICITGDIADSPASDLDGFFPILGRLRATHGVFAIMGNHDHYAGADNVVAALQRHTDFTVLRDAISTIEVRGQKVHIIGVDDRGRDWARGLTQMPELAALLARLPADDAKILLSHRPDVFPQAAQAGVALTLSGHTHGGQLGVPWFGGRFRNLAEFITQFDRGLYQRDGRFLYVNCGLGVTGQRIRLCTPREISVVEARTTAFHPQS